MLRWAKAQGAVTGYAHSGSGLEIDPDGRRQRLLAALDRDADGSLTPAEAAGACCRPSSRRRHRPRRRAHPRGARSRPTSGLRDTLPNFAIPEMNGVGAMEVVVSVPRGRLRLHQRHGHAPDRRMEHVVPPAQLRVPAEGQRRDRFPLHERPEGRPGAGLRPARRRQGGRLRRLVRGHGRRPVVRLGRLRPRPGVHRRRQAAGRPPGAGEARDGRRPGEGRLRRPDAAGGGPRRHRPGRGPADSSATRSTCTGPGATASSPRQARPASSSWWSTAVPSRSREVPADDRVHEPGIQRSDRAE